MKAYGIPRIRELDGGVDCHDAKYYAVKSRRVNLPGKSGGIHSSVRGPKKPYRRPFKKQARAAFKAELRVILGV